MGGMSMPQIMDTDVVKPCFFTDCLPAFFNILQGLSRYSTWKQMFSFCCLLHALQEINGLRRKWQMLHTFLFCRMGWFCPGALLQIKLIPSCIQNFASTRASQHKEPDSLRNTLIGICFKAFP